MIRYAAAALLTAFVAAPACMMSHDLNLGANPSSAAGGDASLNDDAAVTPLDGAPWYSREELQWAKHRCDDGAGALDDYRSTNELQTRLLGAWYRCGNLGFGRSVRFTVDGHVYGLVDAPLGGIADGTTPENVATYSLIDPSDEDAGVRNIGVQVHWTSGKIDNVIPIFQANPKRMKYAESWFVPLLKR